MQLQLRDYVEIAAIFLGPIAALGAQRLLDSIRERRNQKVNLYFTLMRLRAASLTPEYVHALNSIDIVFNKQNEKEKRIREKWRTLMAHYGTDTSSTGWADKRADLTVDLLVEMGESLKFKFDPSHIKRQVYFPKALVDQYWESETLRKQLLEVLSGKRKIPIAMFKQDFPETK